MAMPEAGNASSKAHQSGPLKRAKNDLIASINRLSKDEFAQHFAPSITRDLGIGTDLCGTLHLALEDSASVTRSARDQCFALIEQSSRRDYEQSSIGWHPRRKRREMIEPEMHYLLLRQRSRENAEYLDSDHDRDSVQGFLSFMFTHDSSPPMPAVYIYEIHLAPALRTNGIGSRLMQLVEDIAHRACVEKTMLTCFLSNTKALNFYKRRGYCRDICSPEDRETRTKTVKADYIIMSRKVDVS